MNCEKLSVLVNPDELKWLLTNNTGLILFEVRYEIDTGKFELINKCTNKYFNFKIPQDNNYLLPYPVDAGTEIKRIVEILWQDRLI